MRKFLIFASLLAIFLPACGSAGIYRLNGTPAADGLTQVTPSLVTETTTPEATIPFVPTASPTLSEPSLTTSPIPVQPSPTFSPTPSARPSQPTPAPTLTACMLAGGRIEVHEFTTTLLPKPLIFRIYLPPCYDDEPRKSYPVLYLIHGQTSTDDQWDRLGAPTTADKLIAAGEAAPFIIVMPRDRVWLEPAEDNFGVAVVQSLVPWVDEHYRTLPDREHRAIGGLSRGGAWAVNIGFSHPEIFGAVGVHSGFVFLSEVQEIYLWLNNIPTGMKPRVYMDIGDDEQVDNTEAAVWLEDLLTRFDIPHEWHLFVGEHEEPYWHSHMEDYLRWYTQNW